MQDTRALKNSRNLSSWRTWQEDGYQRSGFMAIVAGVFPVLASAFVIACTLFKPSLSVLEIGSGLYLAATLGLMVLAVLRLNTWKRTNPWTPPS